MEAVKVLGARHTDIPWLIDAHSGKGEDQSDDADPSRAMRGASAAAGSADYTLSLRYANGTFGTQRRLSGKGRFVNVEPMTIDLDTATGSYSLLGSTKTAGLETTWRLIAEMGALTETPRSATEIASIIAPPAKGVRVGGQVRKRVTDALHNRPGVLYSQEVRHGKTVTLYRWAPQ
jgi:hypothetical protein